MAHIEEVRKARVVRDELLKLAAHHFRAGELVDLAHSNWYERVPVPGFVAWWQWACRRVVEIDRLVRGRIFAGLSPDVPDGVLADRLVELGVRDMLEG